jgi:hypothetical protein
MTSAINTTQIDETFPVAGQDNNSQGFRDNFNRIKTALNVAGGEITTLQSNTAKLNAANNFNGGLLENAEVNKFYQSVRQNGIVTTGTTTDIDLENGSLQTIGFTGNITVRFINWADSDLYAKVRLHLKNFDTSGATVTIGTEAGGVFNFVASEFTGSGTPQVAVAAGSEVIVEAWTYNNGVNVYLKNFGTFE